jgi:hypothetical protein
MQTKKWNNSKEKYKYFTDYAHCILITRGKQFHQFTTKGNVWVHEISLIRHFVLFKYLYLSGKLKVMYICVHVTILSLFSIRFLGAVVIVIVW